MNDITSEYINKALDLNPDLRFLTSDVSMQRLVGYVKRSGNPNRFGIALGQQCEIEFAADDFIGNPCLVISLDALCGDHFDQCCIKVSLDQAEGMFKETADGNWRRDIVITYERHSARLQGELSELGIEEGNGGDFS